MNIEIIKLSEGYTVKVDGEIVFECLGEEEIEELTIKEIKEILE